MKKLVLVISVITFISFFNIKSIYAQNSDISVEKILLEKSFNIDLPEYRKAEMIIEQLIKYTALNEQEIFEILDDMVSDERPVTTQILVKIYGYPVFIDTNNPAEDNEKFMKAKDEWIKENGEIYNLLISNEN